MGALDDFLEKQGVVTGHLAAAAEQIPEEKAAWAPCEKCLPWLYLIHHTSIHRALFLKIFKGEPYDFPGCYTAPENQAKNPKEAAQVITSSWEEFRAYLESQPEDFVGREFDPPWGGPGITVENMLWWMHEESVHHRGQAWMYARMNGITPPPIWGTEEA
ncbi:MAG: DinB family protein [Candidatus Nitrospinota bacterium M3_3B_026]